MTKTEQTRLLSWRLKVLRQAGAEGNVARTCRHFGISRKSFYKGKKRYAAYGDAGLCDRPRTPQRSPQATPPDVVSKLLYLRQHYDFGPGRIADYLKRFHQLTLAGSSVHRILVRHCLNRLPANQKYRPHPKRWPRAAYRSSARHHFPMTRSCGKWCARRLPQMMGCWCGIAC